MTSTSGIICAGFHQWVPSARALRVRPAMMAVIGITEVLEARIASAGAAASISAKSACLISSFSGAASKTKAAFATAPGTLSKISIFLRIRAMSLAGVPRSFRLSPIRWLTVARVSAAGSVIATYCPARARVRAMPCPISPAPTTAICRFFIALIPPYSRRRRRGCGRCRNPTPWRRGRAAAPRGPPARRAGPWERGRGNRCAPSPPRACPRTSTR